MGWTTYYVNDEKKIAISLHCRCGEDDASPRVIEQYYRQKEMVDEFDLSVLDKKELAVGELAELVHLVKKLYMPEANHIVGSFLLEFGGRLVNDCSEEWAKIRKSYKIIDR